MRRFGWTWLGLIPATTSAAEPLDPFEHPDESEIFQAEERLFAAPEGGGAPRGVLVASLTDRQIRERGFRSLAQALSAIPGLVVTDGADGRSVLLARGIAGNQRVLLLVDGVPWADGYDERAWIDESLPLSSVRRIEVIEGPGRLGVGDRGVAATVLISTYRPEDLLGGFLRWEVGSFRRAGLSAVYGERRTVRGRDVGLRTYARASRSDGDGSSLTRDGQLDVSADSPRTALGGGLVFEIGGATMRYDHVDWRYSPPAQVGDDPLDVLLQDEAFQPSLSADLVSIEGEIDVGRRLRLAPRLFAQRYVSNALETTWSEPSIGIDPLGDAVFTQDVGLDALRIVSDRYGAGIDSTLQVGLAHVTRLGLGIEGERLVSLDDLRLVGVAPLPLDGDLSAPEAIALRPYAALQHHWGAGWWLELDAALGVAWQQYVCTTLDEPCSALPEPQMLLSPRADLLLLPTSTTSIRLVVSQDQRAPTFEEQLTRRGEQETGNLDLRPETLQRADAIASYDAGRRLSARLGGTAGRLRDELGLVAVDELTGSDPYALAENRDGTQFAGARGELGYRGEHLDAGASYAWTLALDVEQGAPTWGFPAHAASARLVWSVLDGVRVSVLADVTGPRERSGWLDGVEDAPAYGLVHAGITTDLLDDGRARLDVGVRNLLDQSYASLGVRDALVLETAHTYEWEGEGRKAVFGLEFAF